MGMFNYVDFKCDCPTCGKGVKGFQSKDGDCMLTTIQPWQVSRFYSWCRECDTRIEYTRSDEAPVLEELLVEAIMLLDAGTVEEVRSFLDKSRKYISTNQAWLEDFDLLIETKEEQEERWKKD